MARTPFRPDARAPPFPSHDQSLAGRGSNLNLRSSHGTFSHGVLRHRRLSHLFVEGAAKGKMEPGLEGTQSHREMNERIAAITPFNVHN